MRRSIRFALIICALVIVSGAVGIAQPQNPYQSVVSLSLGDSFIDYSNNLTAQVTTNIDGSYHYEYTLDFQQSTYMSGEALTEFSVANRDNLAFTNQGSDHVFSNAVSSNSVLWVNGNVGVGNTVKFWYDSFYSYKVVEVTLSGGLPSSGDTLGMVIPEPSSIIALLTALGGFAFLRKRR
ncbi:PEP-CTERM sorting domain-containing protein [bacterium]|nr:PEP-CTERM sorting domain-containing protein [bacterium]